MSSLEKNEFFELGDKTSLICTDPSTSEAVKATLKELGFRSHPAYTPHLPLPQATARQQHAAGFVPVIPAGVAVNPACPADV